MRDCGLPKLFLTRCARVHNTTTQPRNNHATHNSQLTTHNSQLATHNTQHTQHTTHNTQHNTTNTQQQHTTTTHNNNTQHTTTTHNNNTQQQHITTTHNTHNTQHTQHTQHTTHNQATTDNRQPTTTLCSHFGSSRTRRVFLPAWVRVLFDLEPSSEDSVRTASDWCEPNDALCVCEFVVPSFWCRLWKRAKFEEGQGVHL